MSSPRALFSYRYFGLFRFVLASMVMFQHFLAHAAPEPFLLLTRAYEPGSVAVLVFFCLSGFVIMESADAAYPDRPLAFMSNRLMRVFPHFLIALTLSILLQRIFFATGTLRMADVHPLPPSTFSVGNVVTNFFTLLPYTDRFVSYQFIGIAWAVRVEMAFYLTMALCLLVAAKYKKLALTWVATGAAAIMFPLFVLSIHRHAPPMFGFLPYFSYGAALYYALKGSKAACGIVAASIACIGWQFLSLPDHHPDLGFLRAVYAQLFMLAVLVATMTALATVKEGKLRKTDNRIGSFTYPLYMYHHVVLILLTSLVAANSYGLFIFGMIASVLFSMAMARIFDPLVDAYRDRIRGRRLTS